MVRPLDGDSFHRPVIALYVQAIVTPHPTVIDQPEPSTKARMKRMGYANEPTRLVNNLCSRRLGIVGSGTDAVVFRSAHLFPPLSVGGASLASPSLRFRFPPHRTGQADFPHPAHREGVITSGLWVCLDWCRFRSVTVTDFVVIIKTPSAVPRYSTASNRDPVASISSPQIASLFARRRFAPCRVHDSNCRFESSSPIHV
jgi:hypothetical protein